MIFSITENKARELSVTLATEPLPQGVRSVLLSRCGGAVSVSSSALDPITACLTHALDLGMYVQLINGKENGYFLKYAISLLPQYERELTVLSHTHGSKNAAQNSKKPKGIK